MLFKLQIHFREITFFHISFYLRREEECFKTATMELKFYAHSKSKH